MELAAWLTEQKIKRNEFAGRIGVSPSYITALCNGTVWPGREVVARITAETGGLVTANDFVAPMQSAPVERDGMLAALQEAILTAGGPAELARECEVEPSVVAGWIVEKRVAGDYVEKVEFATGVNRTWLRPDLYPPKTERVA